MVKPEDPKKDIKLDSKHIISVCILVALAFSFFLFSFTGIKVMAVLIIYCIIFYMVLKNISLEKEERLVFGFFLALGLIPLGVYYTNRFIWPSLIGGTVVMLALLVGLSFVPVLRKKK